MSAAESDGVALSEPSEEQSVSNGKEESVINTSLPYQFQDYGLKLSSDGYVRWDNQSHYHPRNWTLRRKAYDTGIIIYLEFITTAIGTAGTSAARQARIYHGISCSFSLFLFSSIYLIGQGIGGITLAPYSETFGRKTLYIVSALGFSLCCVIGAAIPSFPAIIISRFIAGLLSAVPSIVTAGSIEDMYNSHARVWIVFLWTLSGLLALAIGPIYSSFFCEAFGWTWVFYISAIATGLAFVACIFLRESRPSLLLERQVSALRIETSNSSFRTQNLDEIPELRTLVSSILVRPLHLLFTEPILFITSIMGSVVCATLWLFAEVIITVYESFGFSGTLASLAFIPIGIGLLLSIIARLVEHRIIAKRRKTKYQIQPEDRLFGFAIAVPTLAASLWWFAWTIPPHLQVHWTISMLALIPLGFGLNSFLYSLSGYLTDTYTTHAASAFAGFLLSRSFATAVLLPFTNQIYAFLGANVAFSLLATVATLFCIAPYVLIRYGKSIRERSEFARYSLTDSLDNQVDSDSNELGISAIL